MIIENFSVHRSLTALMSISFSAVAFSFGGASISLLVMLVSGGLGYMSLRMAFNNRDEKDALKQLSDVVAIIGMGVAAMMFSKFNITIAIVVLLFFLHLGMNFVFRENRQIFFPLLIDFVALMAGAVFTFSAGYLFYMLLFCLFSCFYLAYSFVDRQRYEVEEIDSSDDEGDSSDERDTFEYFGDWSYLDKLLLTAVISLIAGVIYLLTPHFVAGNVGMPLKGYGLYDGIPEKIWPESRDLSEKFDDPTPSDSSDDNPMPTEEVQQDPSVYYYMRSDKPRYLQYKTATYFDGKSWHRLQNAWRHLPSERESFTLYDDKPNNKVSITVVKNTHQAILATDNTIGLRFPGAWVATDYYDQLKTSKPLKKDSIYELFLDDTLKNGRAVDVRQAKPNKRDLQLPDQLDPRIKKLGNKIVAGLNSDTKKAQALEKYLRTQHYYTLDTLYNQNNVPVAEFLFGSKRGHCEYFATSMAVLLRQQGIPARMIYGFSGQDFNPITGFYEIKGTNAHAWVEAYTDGNWAIFEATGAYESPEQESAEAKNTYQSIETYLVRQKQNASRLKNKKSSTWKKVKLAMINFWYIVITNFSQFMTIAKPILPWVLGIGSIALGGLLTRNYLYTKNRVKYEDKRGFKALQKLGKQKVGDNMTVKNYIHAHLSLYQAMLARHDKFRPIGERIEYFATNLCYDNLATEAQVQQLIHCVNGEFYGVDGALFDAQKVHKLFLNLYRTGMNLPLNV